MNPVTSFVYDLQGAVNVLLGDDIVKIELSADETATGETGTFSAQKISVKKSYEHAFSEITDGQEKSALAFKVKTLLDNYREKNHFDHLVDFRWGSLVPKPSRIEPAYGSPLRTSGILSLQGFIQVQSDVEYVDGQTSSTATIRINLVKETTEFKPGTEPRTYDGEINFDAPGPLREVTTSFLVRVDTKTHNIISLHEITEKDGKKRVPETEWYTHSATINPAIRQLKENHQVPESFEISWHAAPQTKELALHEPGTGLMPSTPSLVTALAVSALIYAGEQTNLFSTLSSNVLEGLPLARFHAFLEEKFPAILKNRQATAATTALVMVALDHFITSNAENRFRPSLGQAAQLTLCGWTTYRGVEKVLTPLAAK